MSSVLKLSLNMFFVTLRFYTRLELFAKVQSNDICRNLSPNVEQNRSYFVVL